MPARANIRSIYCGMPITKAGWAKEVVGRPGGRMHHGLGRVRERRPP
jgi:hypothetical protein